MVRNIVYYSDSLMIIIAKKYVVYDDIYDENSVINYLCACSVGKTRVLWCVNA